MKQESKIPRKTVYAYNQNETTNKGYWWQLEKAALARELFATFNKIEKNHVYRRQMNMNLERMYLGFSPIFFSSVYQNATRPDLLGQRTVINVAKSCVDTTVSRIGTMKARPFFLTNGGDYSQKCRAEKLTDFFDGLFDQIKFYDKMSEGFKDGCISQAGFVKFFINQSDKKIECERVFPDEIMVDDIDAIYGCPQTLYQAKMMSRSTALAQFPKNSKAILNAKCVEIQNTGGQSTADNIWVIEAWHLRSSSSSSDGMHVICIDNETLFAEEYKKDYYPFIQLGWAKRPKGFWYTSIVEEVAGIQLDVNVTMSKIQECHKLCAVPRVWVEDSSAVNIDHITNDVGVVARYRGIPPIFMTPNAVPPELYNHLQSQILRAYETVGISQLDAQAQKPSGVNSAIAMRTYQDIGSQRFKEQASRYEEMQMRAVDILFDLCEELSEGNKLKIMTPSKRMIKKIDWKDARLDREDYILQRYPTNMLPNTPEGKRDTIVDYMNAQLIDKDLALEMLDFPDLKAATNKILSESKIIDKIIDKMLNDGVYTMPEPYYNLDLAMKKVRQAYLLAEVENYDDEKLQLLRNFMEAIATLMEAAQQQQMQQMAAAQMAAQQGMMPQGQVQQRQAQTEQTMQTGVNL
jgi:hypothetical protein